MKPDAVVRAFEEAATQLGVRVRYERGTFRGGRCVVDGETQVVLNKRLPVDTHLDVLAACLRELPHETVYLRPAIRAALEDAWARQDRGLTESADLDADE